MKTSRIQRVLAENNYNREYAKNYSDYGFKEESDMQIKIAQLHALQDYGINKEAFIGGLWNAAKAAYTSGAATAANAGTSSVLGGLKNVGSQAKNFVTSGAGTQALKNNVTVPMGQQVEAIKNTYATGAANAANAGGSGVMGGIKSLGKAAWENPYGQAAIVSGGVGAVMGGLQTPQQGESRLGNMLTGAAGGAVTGAAFTGLQRGMTAAGNKYFGSKPATNAVANNAPTAVNTPPTNSVPLTESMP